MMKVKNTDNEQGLYQKEFHKINVPTQEYVCLNSKLGICFVFVLAVLASLIMSIRSEIDSDDVSQKILNLKNTIDNLEEKWKKRSEENQISFASQLKDVEKQGNEYVQQITNITIQSNNLKNSVEKLQEQQKKSEENQISITSQLKDVEKSGNEQALQIKNFIFKSKNLKNSVGKLEEQQNKQEVNNNYINSLLKDVEKQGNENVQQITNIIIQSNNLKNQVEKLEEQLNKQEENQSSLASQLKDVEKSGNEYEEQINKNNDKIQQFEQSFQWVQDSINQKISLAIQELKIDILKGQVEDKINQSQMQQSLGSLTTLTEFNELKTSLALSKQEIQRLQSDFALIPVEIAEIPNIKKDILNLQTTFNDQIKQANSTLGSTGSQPTTSGQCGSSTTESTSSPTSTSTQTPNDDSLYEPQIYGPFYSPNWNQFIQLSAGKFWVYSTTEACIITVKKKAIITLIATGHGVCHNCHGQGTFMMDRQNPLKENGYTNYFTGALDVQFDWNPINFTQAFIVEPGTHEFTLWFGHIFQATATLEIESLSFVAVVSY